LQTVVKKWFRDKASGFLDNGAGPDIKVTKDNLVNCKFLKVGAKVEFECHEDNHQLIAKKVKLLQQNKSGGHHKSNRSTQPFRPGVMT
jgi:cold shock CspA family protein